MRSCTIQVYEIEHYIKTLIDASVRPMTFIKNKREKKYFDDLIKFSMINIINKSNNIIVEFKIKII